jgi:hypothetical protein
MGHNNHETHHSLRLCDRRRWPRSLWIDGSSAAYCATNALASSCSDGLSNRRVDCLSNRRADSLSDSTGNYPLNGHTNPNANADPVANGQRTWRVE